MGMGTKVSMPIDLDRPQYYNENQPNFTYNLIENIGLGGKDYRYVQQGTPNYGVYNWEWKQRVGNTTQLQYKDYMYWNDGKLSYDPNNPNDVWMFKKELLQGEPNNRLGYYDCLEVIDITPNTLVYDTNIEKNIGIWLVTNEDITANLTLNVDIYICTNGALDTYKTFQTNNDVDEYVKNSRANLLDNITANNYEYQNIQKQFTVDINTSGANARYQTFSFNPNLVKDQNTVIVIYYQMYCSNWDTNPNSLIYDASAINTANGIYSHAIRTTQTTVSGNWSAAEVNQEVIDVPGLMWEILAMPFAFISTAFNLTLFPGTPYSLNITNLFMTLILILFIIFVLKKVIK